MLGTLMKYEFKAVGRILLPLYGAWLLIAIILGLSIRLYQSASGIWQAIVAGSTTLYGFFTAAAVILTALIIIQRFYKNLLGNEGYFMFALPITTGRHLINKTVSAVIWLIIGCVAAALTGLIIAVADNGFSIFQGFDQFWSEVILPVLSHGKSVLVGVECIIIALIFCGEATIKVYAAIAVGHQWGNHRLLGAIGSYIAFGFLEVILVSLFGKIFDKVGLFEFVYRLTNNASDFTAFQLGMLGAFFAAAFLLAVYWFVTWKLLDKRLNLE